MKSDLVQAYAILINIIRDLRSTHSYHKIETIEDTLDILYLRMNEQERDMLNELDI